MIVVLNRLEFLHTLNLSGTQVTDLSAFGSSGSLQNLKELNISGCTQLRGDIIVFKNTPVLENLDLTETDVTGDILVFKNTPALKELNLFNTLVTGDFPELALNTRNPN